MDIILYLKKREAVLGRSKETLKLEVTDSGHLGVQIAHNEVLNEIFMAESKDNVEKDEKDAEKPTEKVIEKVHKALGHMAKERLWSLFRNSGQDDSETKYKIFEISEKC